MEECPCSSGLKPAPRRAELHSASNREHPNSAAPEGRNMAAQRRAVRPAGLLASQNSRNESASGALGTDTPRTLPPLLPRREERAGLATPELLSEGVERRVFHAVAHGEGLPKKIRPSFIYRPRALMRRTGILFKWAAGKITVHGFRGPFPSSQRSFFVLFNLTKAIAK
jgi:hypothetical protein